MANYRISKASVWGGVIAGAFFGFIGLFMIFIPNETDYDFSASLIYAVIATVVFVGFAARSAIQTFPAFIWIAFSAFGILFPICIFFTFISLEKLQDYSEAVTYTAPGGSNGGNYSSENYSGTESGVVPIDGSRFGGTAAHSEPEVTEDAFGQSKSSSAPTSGGPRFGRTTMDEPSYASYERGLHDRIADLDSDETITITLTDGRLFSFNTIAIINLDDDTYCVVESAAALGDIPAGTIGVFKFIWGDDGEELIASVDDEETLDRVEVEFQKLLDAENGSN